MRDRRPRMSLALHPGYDLPPTETDSLTTQGIGARLVRKEDDRYRRGRGQFAGDLSLPHLRDVAFLRSPRAHARIGAIRIPPAIRERVVIAADLAGVAAIRADTALAGFKSS